MNVHGGIKFNFEDIEGNVPQKSRDECYCKFCGKSFTRAFSLKEHMMNVHEGKKQHKCSFCQKLFSKAGNLKHHISSTHEGQKNHNCEMCNKEFSVAFDLKRQRLSCICEVPMCFLQFLACCGI